MYRIASSPCCAAPCITAAAAAASAATCPAGTTAFLPRHLTHTFRSVDGPATILFIVTPGRLDEFFRMREEGMSPAEAFRTFGGAG